MEKHPWILRKFSFILVFVIVILGGCRGSAELADDYDILPTLREYSPPVYPEKFLLSKQEAQVLLNLRIDEEGNVIRVAVVKSSGDPELDQAALEAARNWKYWPASKGGSPVPISIRQGVIFSLKFFKSISFYEVVVSRKELADSLWAILNSGSDISEIARKFSEAPSAVQGGLRDTVRYDTLPSKVRSALDRLGHGQLSRPIERSDGTFVIVKRKKA